MQEISCDAGRNDADRGATEVPSGAKRLQRRLRREWSRAKARALTAGGIKKAKEGAPDSLTAVLDGLAARAASDNVALRLYGDALISVMSATIGDGSGLADRSLNKILQRQLDTYYRDFFPLREEREEVQSFLCEFAALEKQSASFRRKTKATFLKRRIPRAYAKAAQSPLENKAIYLQPRSGLNQTFKYMYEFLDKRGGYDQQLWELHRSEVPFAFYYRNAERMAASAGTAKVVFLHESNNLLGLVDIRPDAKVVQLWHGCGVFKKIGLDTADQPGYKSLKSYEKYPEYSYYSCVTIASPELSWVFEQFMGISKESSIIKPLGVSRTDCFFDEGYREECYRKLYEILPQAQGRKIVLYAPTYRGVGQARVAPDALDIEAMQQALGDEYFLIVKHHQTAADLPPIPPQAENVFAVDMTRGWGMDISELMTVADVCVSDYSSLVFEFSLFERPMAFFVYDLEDYIDDRGLYYDFDEITPGPLCRTTEELIEYLLEVKDGFDNSEVVAFKDKFMCSCDGHSTERIVAYIEGDESR